MGIKEKLKRTFQLSMFGLEEKSATEFYVSCFQKNRSAVPMFLIRLLVFVGSLGILLASLIMTGNVIAVGLWFIFLTHWGLVFITATSGLGLAVSLRALIKGPIDATFGLPWYVKAYWVTYNLTVPIAFFITLFYWVLLTGVDEEFAINQTLDIFIHGINSALMLLLLVTSSHPSRLMHFTHSLIVGIVYLVFSIIYYYAGGLGPTGVVYIYPMLDWSRPVLAVITAAGSTVMFLLMHAIVVAIASARDALTKNYRNNADSLSITNIRY